MKSKMPMGTQLIINKLFIFIPPPKKGNEEYCENWHIGFVDLYLFGFIA